MIRYAYINQMVLKAYKLLPKIAFPLNPTDIVDSIPNCKYMSYQDFARKYGCTVHDVMELCESKSGCTHYDEKSKHFLILCNQSTENHNNPGRQRWTCAHEIGHILCGHHALAANSKLAEHNMIGFQDPNIEAEADYFSATFLSPFPLYRILGVQSVIDVQNTFGLSCEASLYRYKQFLKWKRDHQKSAWENDIVRIYIQNRVK